jgi:hypothetical protein
MRSKKSFINEMPRIIEPRDPDFGFSDSKINQQIAISILRSSRKIEIKSFNDGNIIYRLGNKFILVDPFRRRVLYYFSWRSKFFKLLNATIVSEVLHWRDLRVGTYVDLSQWVFFDLLLPIESAVMTDIFHTRPGARFWMRRISEAFKLGLNVYYVDFLPGKNNKRTLRKLSNMMDLDSMLLGDENDSPWGPEEKFKARRIIISRKNISDASGDNK